MPTNKKFGSQKLQVEQSLYTASQKQQQIRISMLASTASTDRNPPNTE